MESLVGSPKSFSLLLDLDGNEEHHYSTISDILFQSYQTRDMSGFDFSSSITNRLNITNILSIDLRSNQTQRARWIVKRCLLSVSFVCSRLYSRWRSLSKGHRYYTAIDRLRGNESRGEREGERRRKTAAVCHDWSDGKANGGLTEWYHDVTLEQ